MSKNHTEEHLIALKGLEDLLKHHGLENWWEIYCFQGFLSLTILLKTAPKIVYQEVWEYIKKNRSTLNFFHTIPEDI